MPKEPASPPPGESPGDNSPDEGSASVVLGDFAPHRAGDLDRVIEAFRVQIGRRVAQAREDMGFSQSALASMLGKSAAWVAGIERGRQFAPVWLVEILGSATERPISFFFEAQAGEELEEIKAGIGQRSLGLAGRLIAGDFRLAAQLLHKVGSPESLTPEQVEGGRELVRAVRSGQVNAITVSTALLLKTLEFFELAESVHSERLRSLISEGLRRSSSGG